LIVLFSLALQRYLFLDVVLFLFCDFIFPSFFVGLLN